MCIFSASQKEGWCWILAITSSNHNHFQSSFISRSGWNFQQNVYKNSHHTLLLQYLEKHNTCYYCTVNNTFHDQLTLLQFINILNIQLGDMLLMMLQVVYATSPKLGLFDVAIWTAVLPASEIRVTGSAWDLESIVLIRDKELFWQLVEHAWQRVRRPEEETVTLS